MKIKYLYAAVLFLLTLFSAKSFAGDSGLWGVSWHSADPAFQSVKEDEKRVKRFFHVLENVAYKYERSENDEVTREPVSAYTEFDSSHVLPEDYVSHEWMNLDGDDSEELVIWSDSSGRGFFAIWIIFKQDNLLRVQSFLIGRGVLYINEMFQDLDGDGIQELLLSIRISEYSGFKLPVVVPKIYSLTSKDSSKVYVDNTKQLSKLYLPTFLKNISEREIEEDKKAQAWQALSEQSPPDLLTDLTSVKVSRMLATLMLEGNLSDNDFNEVIAMTDSANSDIRHYSLFVLDKSSRAESMVYLQKLMKDSDKIVSKTAAVIYRSKK